MTIDQIIEGLYITDIQTVRTKPVDVDRVITVCQDSVNDNISCEYYHYNIADGEYTQGKYGGRTDYGVFEEAAERVLQSLEDGEDVLVHCHAGQNRSVSVSAAALAVFLSSDYSHALSTVENGRPMANPTETLERHAKRFVRERL